ncbi:hydrogenase maturation nickel metallochaperone HypA [Martelella alba]|uniref:Hydrogenase maturation factor HypA n=1 Tax=Martelella alba TaxID=2590451 RepID=A0ABY2SL92_9HYPH|nr:hydrogenase maturation nickel metallochaperone HypA [Martelella alba]TKI06483.1 hydrogenase maturation nickel metallochaperone HypA [Martelella alba]
MHEMSLSQSALDLIMQQARRHGAHKVTDVWLEVGALSCIEQSALRFCFDAVCRNTPAQGCALHIAVRPAHAWCWACATVVEVREYGEGCPHCGGLGWRVEDGDSVRVKQVALE